MFTVENKNEISSNADPRLVNVYDWNRLVKAEPRLADLWLEAIKMPPNVDGLDVFHGYNDYYDQPSIKTRMSSLVGWGAENPLLRCSEAYDVAYNVLFSALPNTEGFW